MGKKKKKEPKAPKTILVPTMGQVVSAVNKGKGENDPLPRELNVTLTKNGYVASWTD